MIVLDKDTAENAGGLARESFGGVHLVGTPHQRRLGIGDTPELAWRDWAQRRRTSGPTTTGRARWATLYCERSDEQIYHLLDRQGVSFLPLVNWPERGLYRPGNSVPRWHITWGTG